MRGPYKIIVVGLGAVGQAVPVVYRHASGIVYSSVFASCAPDLRLLFPELVP